MMKASYSPYEVVNQDDQRNLKPLLLDNLPESASKFNSIVDLMTENQ